MRLSVMRLVTLFALLSCLTSANAEPCNPFDDLISKLMVEGEVPGVAVALIRNGAIADHCAYGVADASSGHPLRTKAIFESASLSKPIFAYAVLKLVDAGVMELDVPLVSYMPSVMSDERIGKITARMGLAHTTGFPNEVLPGDGLRLQFEPGERFGYSGAAFLLLVRVVEHRTGKTLPSLLRELVFKPLRMRDTTFAWKAEKVHGHTAAGRVIAPRRAIDPKLSMLQTTAGDFARFMIAVMKGKGLVTATRRAMLTPQIRVHDETLTWGLGWGLERTTRGHAFWHWAENNGDTQHFALGYEDGTGIVVLTNSGNGLSIIPEIVSGVVGGDHPSLAWIGYDSYRSPMKRLWRDIKARGAGPALQTSLAATLDEKQINRVGYMLLELGRLDEAIAVFQFNVARFPESFNVYDSLGEAYAAAGDQKNAIVNYRRSLDRNPNNDNAARMLRKLTQSDNRP